MKRDLYMDEGKDKTTDSSLLKQAFLAIQEMQAKLEAAELRSAEPIAIVGMGCRFPGGAVDGETFWNLLREGRDAVTPIPADRWDAAAYYDPDPDKPGKMVSRRGGFLDQVDQFDARFFEIAPREAAGMDPQQRLALEIAWETLENAGYAPAGLQGTKTGVFLGIASNDYSQLNLETGDADLLDAHYASGVAHSIASGRISYLLGLEGPSISLDTACSSSLVAVHLACQSLRLGDCTLALAGGVNIMLAPETTALLSRVRMLSPDGRCKAFDADADGFVRGEGCGFVALKTLSQAQADGDRILAVIRGTAVNQDGASSSLTAPNGPSQMSLMRQALVNAGVEPGKVSYVEAHGTGTALGDPIELQALGAVYGAVRTVDKPLMVGSLKTNMGHLEAGAGVAGLIKTVLALRHRQIPPHLHLKTPTPHVRWKELRLTVPQTLTDWPAEGDTRVAAVSSFGFSGTNAHVVVAEAAPLDVPRNESGWPTQILTVSAKSNIALRQLIAMYHNFLENNPATDLRDFCFTANTGRSHFQHRACFVAPDLTEMKRQLAGFEVPADSKAGDGMRVGYLFTGQGSQYGGMGRELYESSAVFREGMERCAAAWKQESGESLTELLYPSSGEANKLEEARCAQPALFAFEYALAEQWRSWGVEPSVVLGHSLGEYVAAVIAGVFSVEDGLRLVCARARLMDTLSSRGAMRSVSAPMERVQAAIAGSEDQVSIGAINGPETVVISGAAEAVERIARKLEGEGIRTRALAVTHAFHSPLLEPILEEFERSAEKVKYHAPRIRMISNLTGEVARAEEVTTARYWREHMRRTVQFDAGLRMLLKTGCNAFLEIGPQPHLLTLSKSAHSNSKVSWLPSARRGRNAWLDILNTLQALYNLGAEIDWKALHGKSGRPIALPTYPFERQRYWFSSKPSTNVSPTLPRRSQGHPLLGSRLQSPLSEIQFESRIGPDHPAYLSDHVVAGRRVVPAAAYLEMALSAAREVSGKSALVRSAVFLQPCIFDEPQVLQCVLDGGKKARTFAIYSRPETSRDREWVLHATGEIAEKKGADVRAENQHVNFDEIGKRCRDELDAAAFYQMFEEGNVHFGPNFRPITRIVYGPGEALVEFEIPSNLKSAEQYQVHPVALDACFQAAVALLLTSRDDRNTIYLPATLESLHVIGDWRNLLGAHGRIQGQNDVGNGESLTADICGFDHAGNVVLVANGLMLRPFKQENPDLSEADSIVKSFYEVEWTPVQAGSREAPDISGTCILCGDEELTSNLSVALERNGIQCAVISPSSAPIAEVEQDYGKALQGIKEQRLSPISDLIYVAPMAPKDISRISSDTLMEIEERSLGDCLRITQALLRMDIEVTPRLWIVTRGAQGPALSNVVQSTLWGFGRSLSREHPEMRVLRIDLDPAREQNVEDLLRCMRTAGVENELALRGNEIYAPRLRRLGLDISETKRTSEIDSPNTRLELIQPGTLEGLEIVSADRRAPARGEVEIQVAAAALNFRDVLNVLGVYKGKSGPLGGECAGTVTRVGPGVESLRLGDEVVALAQGCFAKFVTARADLVLPKPARLSFEAAVTIPITFLTAWHALKSIADIQPGERVLIHAAAGGVGLAAIQIALQAAATVFATAGSAEKRAYLASIGVQKVMDSRSLKFVDEIREATNGCGVDVVVNSLAGPFIDASMETLAPGGRFVELGVADVRSAESVAKQKPHIRYQSFNLAPALETGESFIREILDAIFTQVQAGTLQPLPRTIFSMENARDAFRYMAQARHIGRVVICPQTSSANNLIRKDSAYLVTGGFSGVGLEVAKWLANSGAAQVIIMGRSPANVEAMEVFRAMREAGATVSVCQGDVAKETDVAAALTLAEEFPLRGVFHCAGALDDGTLLQQNWERFQHALSPKLEGVDNLHRLTLDHPLDHFVLFSSIAAVFGSPGQTNYAAANAFLDGMAQYRRSHGLPALSINWGAWSETGMALRHKVVERGSKTGIAGMSTQDGLRALEISMKSGRPQMVAARIDWNAYFAGTEAQGKHPLFSELRSARREQTKNAAAQSKNPSWLPQLQGAVPVRREALLRQLLEERVQTTLGLGLAQEIDPAQPLQELGLDSLLSIELRNSLSACLERSLPATLLFNYPTLNTLVRYISQQALAADFGTAQQRPLNGRTDCAPSNLVEDIESLSDEEVDRLLSARAMGGVQ